MPDESVETGARSDVVIASKFGFCGAFNRGPKATLFGVGSFHSEAPISGLGMTS